MDENRLKIDISIGKAPLGTRTPLTGLLNTAPVPCSISLSPSTQMSMIFAPSTQSSMSFFMTLFTTSAAVYGEKNKERNRRKRFELLLRRKIENKKKPYI
jgi:hypothetical protein